MQTAIERIFPLVYEFRKERSPADEELWQAKRALRNGSARDLNAIDGHLNDPMELVTLSEGEEKNNCESDQSWD